MSVPIHEIIKTIEIVETHLQYLEELWEKIKSEIPSDVAFGESNSYTENCLEFNNIQKKLPAIDGVTLDAHILDLDTISQMRFDIMEIGGDIESKIALENAIYQPEKALVTYRHQFETYRKTLCRKPLKRLIATIDDSFNFIDPIISDLPITSPVKGEQWREFSANFNLLRSLVGKLLSKYRSWENLTRHLHFALVQDYNDIKKHDWPSLKSSLLNDTHSTLDDIPVKLEDLNELEKAEISETITNKLNWAALSPDDFERLIFNLITNAKDYENATWVTQTNAPDRGRDIAADQIFSDSLCGVKRRRVLIQCKHWIKKSISPVDFVTLREQIKAWQPPRIDLLIIASSGRFTADAVAAIERHNVSDSSLEVAMWPESHLEKILATKPMLVTQFGLR